MRAAAILFPLITIACSGSTASTPAPEPAEPPVEPVAKPPPAPVRVAFGQCSEKKVPFVSGARLQVVRPSGAFASLTGTGKVDPTPTVSIGGATSSAGLDKNIIRRYIRRKLPRIQNCYERELLINSGLRGTVTVRFEIAPNGKVAKASATGIAKVSSCVSKAIATINFPRPIGGKRVTVSYPFHFKPKSYGTIGYGGLGTGYRTRGGGAVQIGKATQSSGLHKDIIRRYIRRKLPRIQNCYERQLLVKPKLKGTIRVRFEIATTGAVEKLRLASGFNAKVDACVKKVVGGITFPKPKRRVRVTYPFKFKKQSPTGAAGIGLGTIGTGKYGTIGHGSSTGSGYGTGSGRGGMRGRKAKPPQVRIGQAVSNGSLDKNIIRRYIRRQLRRIRLCYERQLLVAPNLAGKVTVRFTIEPSGKVSGATASGLHRKVDSCVARVISQIRFPKPRGGGTVTVRYPFIFRGSSGTAVSSGPSIAKDQAIAEARRQGILGVLGGGLELVASPLAPATNAIQACAREHLDLTSRHDALIADLGDKPVVRSSGQHRALERCVTAAVEALGEQKEMRCPIAVGTMTVGKLPRITIAASSLSYGGRPLADLDDGGAEALTQALRAYRESVVAPGFTPDIASIGPVVVTADPDVAMGRVSKVLSIADDARVGVALAHAPDRLLRAEPLPWSPVPAQATKPAGAALVITIGSDIHVGGKAVALDKLEAELAKRGEKTSRRVAVEFEATARFADVSEVLSRLAAAGFTDWDLSR